MTGNKAPEEIRELARARAEARAARDWPEADRLRAAIESAGWAVVDRGTHFELSPLHAPDLTDGDIVRYGSSASVPSRLADPAIHLATIVIVAGDAPADLARTLASLRTAALPATQVIVVADAPSVEVEASLRGEDPDLVGAVAGQPVEIVWTSARLGPAGAVNAGLRRASGGVVILLDPCVEASGDFVSPLLAVLADPGVAVAGPWGLTSSEFSRFVDGGPGDVDVIAGSCLAFRRDEFVPRGPLDERFRARRDLDAWWSLILRDEGDGRRPRRAVAVDGMPVIRHDQCDEAGLPPAERERLGRRNHYRLLDRFRTRGDLISGAPGSPGGEPSPAGHDPSSTVPDPARAG